MKIFKKIVLTFIVVLILISIGGYIYFNQKFTPEKNYLTVKNESGNIPITWLGNDKNVLLVPIHFPADSTIYYLQFDTGSPSTVFYSNSIKNIRGISVFQDRAKALFTLGKTEISSEKFILLHQGKEHRQDSLKIIGTLGADILENNKTLINFKENYLVFNLSKIPSQYNNQLMDFTFKKRKIILKGILRGREEQFLFDSGTSAYELLTNKETWKSLKSSNSNVSVERAQSWQKILTSFTATCNQTIQFQNKKIPLHQVTYVEGFSQTQYALMKFSGMTGMLGNRIFLNNILYLDGKNEKIAIE
ncbi:hypothetical protein [Chryseobacterium taiwanense]|uniref:Peptidase A2 domain-containing protein n=1 Tax=Chryseobacterium taiwanense TaxID=363331 RepID=A0A0B4CRF4_9FLAO|nr:hypothetical protein [Chryseobacterium taiwanense]KIC63779.1 hypothetical protein RM51_08530 [Chryseobacterium taiwanense]